MRYVFLANEQGHVSFDCGDLVVVVDEHLGIDIIPKAGPSRHLFVNVHAAKLMRDALNQILPAEKTPVSSKLESIESRLAALEATGVLTPPVALGKEGGAA